MIIVTVLTACTTVVDFDIPLNKPTVVVNSLFTPDSTWQVQVSYSNSILNVSPGSHFQPAGNAIVTILDSNNQVIEILSGHSDKYHLYSYQGQTKPLSGRSYTVQVAINDEPILKAMNKVPTQVPIASVQIDSSRFKSDGEPIDMDIDFIDPADEKNYYQIKIIEDAVYVVNNDTVLLTQELYFKRVEQTLANEITDEESGPEKLITDNLFDGKNRTVHIKLYRPRFSYSSSIIERHARMVLLSVSEEYYNYFTTKNLQGNSNGDPFAQPVQVFTNVENGLGIFAGYNASVVELK